MAALAGSLVAAPASAQGKPPITIGEINSYTGPVSGFTLPYRNGMEMAIDEINAKGGLLGRQLKVLHRDDNFSPADAVRLANELVLNEKVDLLAGTFLSPVALAVANYANEKKVVFVAAEALTNQLTWEKGSRYVFRVRNPMSMLTQMLVSKAVALKCSRWAGIGPINEAISDMMNEFKATMPKKRKDFVWAGELYFPNQKLDPGSSIARLERMKPECVLNGSFGPDLIKFAREGKTLGFFDKVQVVSVLSGEPEYMDPLGADTPVGWWVTGFPLDDNRPALKKFKDDYMARFKQTPRFGSLIGYVTIEAIAAGIKRAGSTDTGKLIQGLKGAKFESPIGELTMRAGDHQLTLGSWVGQLALKDGKPTMVNWTFIDGKDALPSEAEGAKRRPPGAND
ncbi:MAG TPA: ABC transporter substrate-binding protein [Lacipirellulaceae bacterium]|nr:ABC transporter substrate-binding protein [Lacipirellulaceae bacterium]